MLQNAALEKDLELGFDELRQAGTGSRFGLGEKSLELFLHYPIQRRFLRAAPPGDQVARSSLTNPGNFALELDAAYRKVRRRWCENRP